MLNTINKKTNGIKAYKGWPCVTLIPPPPPAASEQWFLQAGRYNTATNTAILGT